MKRISLYLVLTFLFSSGMFGQKLTLTDLMTLCSKKNWQDVNQSLNARKWVYFDSEKGSSTSYNTISWSFNKDRFSEKAQAWFHLYTYDGFPNKISYSVFNKESYSVIQNALSSSGFKLVNSEIENKEIVSTYANSNYILKISIQKRDDTEYTWETNSLTAYNFTLIKKAGIYDPDNGKKTDYYPGGVVKAEYTLANGELNGLVKVYQENGELTKVGNYLNGVEHGLFKEYGEDGELEAEYSMSHGKMNGPMKLYYPDGRLKKSGYFLNGKEYGTFVEYDDYGNKESEYVMENGMKSGVEKIYKSGKVELSITYKEGLRNGPYTEYYYDDDTDELNLKFVGNYLNDKKTGPLDCSVPERKRNVSYYLPIIPMIKRMANSRTCRVTV